MKKLILLTIVTLSVNIVSAQWVQTNGPNGGYIYSIVISGTNIFAGTYGGGVFLSSDNGANWTAVNNGLTNSYVRSLAISGTNIFAGTAGGGVFFSSDNGAHWTAVNNGLSANTFVYSLAISGTNIFAGTDYHGVFFSSNNGANWTAVNNGLIDTITYHAHVFSLAISGTNIFAGTEGDGVWKRPLSELNGIKEISNNEQNIVIYPNPNRGKFSIAQTGNIKSIEIYNVMGEIVYKSRASNAKIDISVQPKGIYFVKVDNGKKVHVEKFVLN